jgi:hypothetical protein
VANLLLVRGAGGAAREKGEMIALDARESQP